MGDWDGTVELAETMTVTLFSVRIALFVELLLDVTPRLLLKVPRD